MALCGLNLKRSGGKQPDGFNMNVRGADIKLEPFRGRGKLYHLGRVNGECRAQN